MATDTSSYFNRPAKLSAQNYVFNVKLIVCKYASLALEARAATSAKDAMGRVNAFTDLIQQTIYVFASSY